MTHLTCRLNAKNVRSGTLCSVIKYGLYLYLFYIKYWLSETMCWQDAAESAAGEWTDGQRVIQQRRRPCERCLRDCQHSDEWKCCRRKLHHWQCELMHCSCYCFSGPARAVGLSVCVCVSVLTDEWKGLWAETFSMFVHSTPLYTIGHGAQFTEYLTIILQWCRCYNRLTVDL